MRRKPSIFSREYEKRMRKRKILISLIVVLVIIAVGVFFVRSSMQPLLSKEQNSVDADASSSDEAVNSEEGSSSEESKNTDDEINKEAESKSYDITVADGVTVKASYDEIDGTKNFKLVDPGSNDIAFDISPTSQNVVILDKKSQKMVCVNSMGETKDITMSAYVSSKGQTFNKDAVLKSNSGYVWCSSPKFIDDTHVAYISQLPWFNKDGRYYVWLADTSANSHYHVNGPEGASVTLGNVSNEGILIEADGKNFTLDANGGLKQN